MDKPVFVYITYIRTTPDLLWRALTEPTFTKQWWNTELISQWSEGSPITWETGGVTIAHPDQVVLESDPGRKLSYAWHTFTPEIGQLHGFSDELLRVISSEPRSRATFEIEPIGEMVKLTVTHDRFEPGSTVVTMISQGWPQLLSSLKSFLETGEPLSAHTDAARQAR